MKNLFGIIMLLSSIHLFSADHPWTRDDGSGKKSKKISKSYPDLLLMHTKLDDEDEKEVSLSLDPTNDHFLKKHEELMQRIKDIRSDLKGLEKILVTFSCNTKTLEQQVVLVIKPPINTTQEAKVAKREQRIATLKQTKALLPLILQGSDKQSEVIRKLLSIIDDLCPEQK